jgi:putative ABC transport system permease protein
MNRPFIKTALRSLSKNKQFTLLNILGLALGMATCLLIVAYVLDEVSFDHYNKMSNRIYRVDVDIRFGGSDKTYATVPAPMGSAMKSEFPQVVQSARLADRGGLSIRKGNQHIKVDKALYADPSLFEVFTLPIISGDPKTALKEPKSVVLTENMAQTLFGTTEALGSIITVDDSTPYKVTAVIKNLPSESHIQAGLFISMSSLEESKDNSWLVPAFNTYVLLKPGANPGGLEAQLPAFLQAHAGPQLQEVMHLTYDAFQKSGNYMHLKLMPLTDIHLKSDKVGELGPNGSILYVRIFTLIALFVLGIACMNFMNLSTARSSNRAKEVGVRKVLGSPRAYLITQFLSESIILALISMVIGVAMAFLCLPYFNNLSGKSLNLGDMSIGYVPVLLGASLVIGCLAGIYPALVLSGFKPVNVLKGKLASGFKDKRLRSVLVVSQFSVSVFLIISTLIIYTQLSYIQHKDLGYQKDNVLIIHNVASTGAQAKAFKEAVSALSGVTRATLSGTLPTTASDNIVPLFKTPVADPQQALISQFWTVDEDYVSTMGMSLKSGRSFQSNMPSDSSGIIINEAAAKLLGLSDPLHQKLYLPQDNEISNMRSYSIVGVLKDFNYKSLRMNVAPLVMILGNDPGALSIRIQPGTDLPRLLWRVEGIWKRFSPNQSFTYSFLDQDFDGLYRSERRMGSVFICFAVLAILISCLGLFGLTAFASAQKEKEIGIRKVLGASAFHIVQLLSVDFMKLVTLSILIAIPACWWVMHQWLEGFAYREQIQWWFFAVSGLLACLIALATISSQTLKAAWANPTDSLKEK